MSEEARMFYKHIKRQLKYVPNTTIAERLKKHILAHPNFNSSRNFLDAVVANYCTNRKNDRLPDKKIIGWLGNFLDTDYINTGATEGEK
ncbi:hypothetical protein [Streptococcus anginosus]|uniref:hypothetical protein n=1 Tax=Streptococcus anginosus TaxID=1328 RepID=UPI003081A575|nr:hypothetical protein LPZ00_000487 [Streptococcus anginosus]